jgi:hypothetical protein
MTIPAPIFAAVYGTSHAKYANIPITTRPAAVSSMSR